MEEGVSVGTIRRRKFDWLKIALIGMTGYLVGSFVPAGYVRYLVQSKLFPETLAYNEPKFDRAKLRGAVAVSPKTLTDAFDTNPAVFQQRYLDKPVKLTGTVKYFLKGSSSSDELTLTLDTGGDYETGIIMTFDNPKAAGVLALREGAQLTATCLASGTSSDNVHLSHCETSS
jgi:tRNA_anti-like